MHILRPSRLALGVVALALLSRCGGGGGDGGGGPGGGGPGGGPGTAALAGTIEFSDEGDASVLEVEPNDTIDAANVLGVLRPGGRRIAHGRASARAEIDPQDAFRLILPQRSRVRATLRFDATGPLGANDFDLGVFDPTSLQYVEAFLAPTGAETAAFVSKGVVDVVVAAAAGEGGYTLTLEAESLPAALPEDEPNDEPVAGQFVGEVLPSDGLTVVGSADAITDPSDVVLLTAPIALSLGVRLESSGGDFEVEVSDATSGLVTPTLLESLTTGTGSLAAVPVSPGSLVAIHVRAIAGSGDWELVLQGGGEPSGAAATLVQVHGRLLAPTTLEALRWKPGLARAPYGRAQREFLPNEALVAAAPSERSFVEFEVERRGGRIASEHQGGYLRVSLPAPAQQAPEEMARGTIARIAGLQAALGARRVEPNLLLRGAAEPLDEFYALQWHYAQINLPAAWEVTTGADSVVVAVVDTGSTNHVDLLPRLAGGYDFVSDPAAALDGDGIDPDPTDPGDGAGTQRSTFHGTHVAGTIGAATNNGIGVAGVTWLGRLMPLRVLGRGGAGSLSDVAQAIRYAARLPNDSGTLPPERAHVINLSLGAEGTSAVLQSAVTAARNAGCVLVAAAGNESSSASFVPASLAGVVSVGAVGPQNDFAPYSNFGPSTDLVAPGGDLSADRTGDGYADGVLSTLRDDSAFPVSDVFAFYEGTSMAAPHVAGVAALVLSVAPTLSPSEVEGILFGTATDLGDAGRDDRFGHGLIDAHQAVLAARGTIVPAPVLVVSPPSVSFDANDVTADVLVENGGGGMLLVLPPSVVTESGGDWLSAALFGDGDATKNVDGVRLTVDRTGVPDGSHAARVLVPSNGGLREIQVLMLVGGTPEPPPDLDVVVRAVDATTLATVAFDVVNPRTSLAYRIEGLPPGDYLILAGSDRDADDELCESDDWCGAWPVEADPAPITLANGEKRTGLDFVVAPDSGPETFPLARP